MLQIHLFFEPLQLQVSLGFFEFISQFVPFAYHHFQLCQKKIGMSEGPREKNYRPTMPDPRAPINDIWPPRDKVFDFVRALGENRASLPS